jgi:hypothetical protein
MQTTFCQTPTCSAPARNGIVTDGPISAARTWLWPLVSALRALCSLEDGVEVGVASGLVLDGRHAAGRVGDEHGAQSVGQAGVVDGLLGVRGDVEHVAVALRVEGEFLVP